VQCGCILNHNNEFEMEMEMEMEIDSGQISLDLSCERR